MAEYLALVVLTVATIGIAFAPVTRPTPKRLMPHRQTKIATSSTSAITPAAASST